MILGTSVFLQPRVNSPNTPSWPTEPTTPPPATDADGGVLASPSLTPDSNASPVNADADSWTTGGQEGSYLTQEVCQSASQTGLVVSGGYALSAAMLGVVFFLIARRKLWWSGPTRYLISLGVAAVAAFVLVASDPAQSDVLAQCINPASGFSQYVFLGGTTIARALVLGLVPAVLLTFVGSYVANRS